MRRHLRHQHRVRLRLPARQHGPLQGRHGPARPRLRHRRRGRLDPGRRSPHAAHHQRPGGGVGPALLPVRGDRARAQAGGRLRGRGEEAHGGPHRCRHREGGGPARRGQHVRRRLGELRAPARERPSGQGALQAGQGLRRHGRRGEDRRRVHGPVPRGAAVVRWSAPSGRGQGAGEDQGREPHLGHRHSPELLPPVREAGRHDRYGRDRGLRVRQHLRTARGAHSNAQADDPHRQRRRDLQDRAGQVRRRGRRRRRTKRQGPARAHRDGLGGEVRGPLPHAREEGDHPHRPKRQAARPGSQRGCPGGPRRGRHRGHQHGRPRGRHHPGRQPRGAGSPGGRGRGPGPRERGGPGPLRGAAHQVHGGVLGRG